MPPEIAGYQIGRSLGAGGFAHVYQAWQTDGGQAVAIKVGHVATDYAREAFAHEGEVLRRIGPPYVPELYDHGVLDNGRPYLVMTRVDDPTLATHLENSFEPIAVAQVVEIARAVLASLDTVHAYGYLHLDLTPENIFIATRAEPAASLATCLVDFGLARTIGDSAPNPPWDSPDFDDAMVAGSIEYMAPERLAGVSGPDVRIDIYSFGVILYELLTMRVPFVGDTATIARGHRTLRPPHPGTLSEVPESLAALCMRCLRKDPNRRPDSVSTVVKQLDEAAQKLGTIGASTKPSRVTTTGILTPGRQPVVLIAAEFPSIDATATATIARYKGVVARQDGRHAICAFAALHDDNPLKLALRAARAMRDEHQARLTIHLTGLKVRPGKDGRPPKVYGPELEHPHSWQPRGNWHGIYLTNTAAEVLSPSQSVAAPHDRNFAVLIDEGEETPPDAPPLVGDQSVFYAATANLEHSLVNETPGLFTIIGDHGLGKSRLCHELEAYIRHTYPDVHVLTLGDSRSSEISLDALELQLTPIVRQFGSAGAISSIRRAKVQLTETSYDTTDEAHRLARALRRIAGQSALVVIIDDLHYADDAVLEALEYAAIEAAGTPLWLVVSANPRFERRRPRWGQRALNHQKATLGPLDEDDATALAAALLHPVEYPPPATLQRIARWTGGNPQALVALIKSLFQAGIVRQGRQDDSWYIATAELERLPASPVGQWLVGRTLMTLPDDIAACARICAVLGVEFQRNELEFLQNAAEHAGVASTPVDTDVGLKALAQAEVLREVRPGWWRFAQPSFQDALYKLIERRDIARLHRLALGFWHAQALHIDPEQTLEAIARHGEGAGDGAIAAHAYLELGKHAQARHRDVDADGFYSQAIHACDNDRDRFALDALRGRGRCRYRLYRMEEAIEDFARACAGAEALGDDELHANLLLEQATALDWAEKLEASSRCVEHAKRLSEHLDSQQLSGRLLMAEGRSAYRAGHSDNALELLLQARRIAKHNQDSDTHIISLLLLGPIYVRLERLDEAEVIFDEAISACNAIDDRFHLCAGYNNRAYLWLAKKSTQGTMADLGQAREIAREAGWLVLERAATQNLAEFLHWGGAHENALNLARRAYTLQRFMPDQLPANLLLLARILAACNRLDEARDRLAEVHRVKDESLTDNTEISLLRMLDIYLDSDDDDHSPRWEDLISSARNNLPHEEFLEILYFRGRAAVYTQRWSELRTTLAQADAYLAQASIWKSAFSTLKMSISSDETAVS